MKSIYQYIDQNKDMFLQLLENFCRQPSVSATGEGMSGMAALLRMNLSTMGFSVEEKPGEKAPVLIATLEGLIPELAYNIYLPYDTPAADADAWGKNPYDASVKNGKLTAPGAAGSKGSLAACLSAIHTFRILKGSVPFTLRLILDGESLIGSPTLKTLLKEEKEAFSASALLSFGVLDSSEKAGSCRIASLGGEVLASQALQAVREAWDLQPETSVADKAGPAAAADLLGIPFVMIETEGRREQAGTVGETLASRSFVLEVKIILELLCILSDAIYDIDVPEDTQDSPV